ncbi:MAG: hypothetical protein WC485_12335, partial [Opitutaceae bacterium]
MSFATATTQRSRPKRVPVLDRAVSQESGCDGFGLAFEVFNFTIEFAGATDRNFLLWVTTDLRVPRETPARPHS